MKRNLSVFIAIFLPVLLTACGGGSGGGSASSASPGGASPRSFGSTQEMVKAVQPGVVKIETDEGIGSGFFINSEGEIATNYHVVRGYASVNVFTYDAGSNEPHPPVTGIVLGHNSDTDIAVILPIEGQAKGITALPWGNSSHLSAGQEAVAIGAPKGYDQTATRGIISSSPRSFRDENGEKTDFIQYDGAISPGNSGGPLLNSAGEVVGINDWIDVSQYSSGLHFAVPSDVARADCEKIIRAFKNHPLLGIEMNELTSNMDPNQSFVFIKQVTPGSLAEQSGFQNGDHVVSYRGIEINHYWEMITLIRTTDSGTKADAVVIRNGRKKRLHISWPKVPEATGSTEAIASG